MTLLISTYDLLHQLEPSFLPDQYPAPKHGKKSISQYLCNLAVHLMEQKPHSSYLQPAADIFKKGIWSSPFIFVCPNVTCTSDILEFQACTSGFLLCRGFAAQSRAPWRVAHRSSLWLSAVGPWWTSDYSEISLSWSQVQFKTAKRQNRFLSQKPKESCL